ncbi:TetR/AcrR family transcriptional regulator [Microbacterium esteraromaticum]|uniref:TetR/AcrR family transcriptional regulator n=1 Tax=Microbacterium esteraromaticum TaxID=57043 RepID=UPI0019D33407|nr:TetR/AcrR family transcriptional regulator [Microbacterium esteraromaticum]MBN7794775.1 TetR/AcrR family transcriptional regulator [Microbacterium esteraromaticum]
MTDARAPRADAVRNRARLLDAAELEFAERGLDVSVADIATRAGVGKGTVFRHFATKEDLLATVVVHRLEKLIADGERLADTSPSDTALFEFVTLAAGQQQDELSVLTATDTVNDQLDDAQSRLFALMERLVADARAAGVLRPDVTGEDVALLICAPGHVAGFAPDRGPDLWRRYLGIILDGLRPDGAHPLSH